MADNNTIANLNRSLEVEDSILNEETLDAMREVADMKQNPTSTRTYSSVDELMKDIFA